MKRYSIAEVQEKLGISRHAMMGIIARYEIDVIIIGKRKFITEAAFKAYEEKVYSHKTEPDTVSMSQLAEKVNMILVDMDEDELSSRETVLLTALSRALTKKSDRDLEDKDRIEKALNECRWSRKAAAEMLGMPYSTLQYKIRKFGIA